MIINIMELLINIRLMDQTYTINQKITCFLKEIFNLDIIHIITNRAILQITTNRVILAVPHLKINRARQAVAHLPINKVRPRELQYVELKMGATPLEILQG